jgi:hypothetical protein
MPAKVVVTAGRTSLNLLEKPVVSEEDALNYTEFESIIKLILSGMKLDNATFDTNVMEHRREVVLSDVLSKVAAPNGRCCYRNDPFIPLQLSIALFERAYYNEDSDYVVKEFLRTWVRNLHNRKS